MDSIGSGERSRKRSMSPWVSRTQGVPSRGRDSEPASNDGGRSRSPSPPRRRYLDPFWKRQMRTMPVEHSKFIWDIVSYISNLQAFIDFTMGCGIPSCTVQRAMGITILQMMIYLWKIVYPKL